MHYIIFMFQQYKKVYKVKGKFKAFSPFQFGFRPLIELVRKYWTQKINIYNI